MRAPCEIIPAVGVVTGGPAIAETDVVQVTVKVVEMIVPDKYAADVAGNMHGGEKARIDARTADRLIFLPQAVALAARPRRIQAAEYEERPAPMR